MDSLKILYILIILYIMLWYSEEHRKTDKVNSWVHLGKCTKCIQYFILFILIEKILPQNMKLKNIVLFPLEIWKNIFSKIFIF